jgi:hypothetical protein
VSLETSLKDKSRYSARLNPDVGIAGPLAGILSFFVRNDSGSQDLAPPPPIGISMLPTIGRKFPEAITHPKMPHSTGLSPPVKIDADPSTRKLRYLSRLQRIYPFQYLKLLSRGSQTALPLTGITQI